MTIGVSVVDGLAMGLLYFTVAAGLTLTLGTLRVLNLAHGSAYLAGTWVAWQVGTDTLPGLGFGMLAAIAAGMALGGLSAAVTWPLRHAGHLAQALATLGLSFVCAQGFAAVTGGGWLPAEPPPPLDAVITVAGASYPAYRLLFIAAAFAIAGLLWWTTTRTRAGALIRAVADEPQMVSSLGINPAAVHATVFAAGTALTVATGVLAAPILPGGPAVDEHLLVMSLLIVVLGRPGDLRGAFLAALVAGQVDTIGPVLAPAVAPFALFAALIVVVAIRPHGLGRRPA